MSKSAHTLVFWRLFSYTISLVSLGKAILSLTISIKKTADNFITFLTSDLWWLASFPACDYLEANEQLP